MPGFAGMGYTGYQAGLAYQFRDVLDQNKEHLQMAYLFDDVLCSHAGISWVWLVNKFGPSKDESMFNWHCDDLEGVKNVVDLINQHFIYKPGIFEFDGWDPYGGNTTQTPIWIRPKSLMAANKDTTLKQQVTQVVGHTQVTNIFDSFLATQKAMGNKYYLIDAIGSKGYLVNVDGEFIPKIIN